MGNYSGIVQCNLMDCRESMELKHDLERHQSLEVGLDLNLESD